MNLQTAVRFKKTTVIGGGRKGEDLFIYEFTTVKDVLRYVVIGLAIAALVARVIYVNTRDKQAEADVGMGY